MSITAAQGFEAGGAAVGIKPSGAPDLAIVVTADRKPVPAAGDEGARWAMRCGSRLEPYAA